jgi:flagellar motor switch protein FliM
MSSNEPVLSQEEVDALTQPDSTLEGEVTCSQESVQLIDFSSQVRLVRSQFSVLEKIHERFSKKLSELIYSFMSREVDVHMEVFKVVKQEEYFVSLKNPSSINTIRIHPLRGKALIVFNDELVYMLVDNYFGGYGRKKTEQEEREFTPTETRIMNIIIKLVLNTFVDSWAPVMVIKPEVIKNEINPQLVNMNHATDDLLLTRLKFDFKEIESYMDIVIPYTMLEPIREQLDIGSVRNDDDIDPNWGSSLREEILDVNLKLHATLATQQINLSKIIEFKVGDIIPIEIPDEIKLNIEAIPGFKCKYGVSRDKCALKIISKM